jgi:broad specificity phosphatase PhoE
MKVYFAAHATSKDNEAGISFGWKDVELSELGKKQAKELGERFAGIPFKCQPYWEYEL